MSMKKIAEKVLTEYFEEELVVKKTKRINSEYFVAQIIKEGDPSPFWASIIHNFADNSYEVLDDEITEEEIKEELKRTY